MMDDRAVNIAITHGLTLAITTVLISGLLIGAGNVLTSQEQQVAQAQFDEIGGDLTSQLNTLDRLNETGEDVNVTVQPNYPEHVAGQTWNLELIGGDDSDTYDTESVVRFDSPHHQRTIEYPFSNSTQVDYGSPANSHEPIVSLCEGEIGFGECS